MARLRRGARLAASWLPAVVVVPLAMAGAIEVATPDEQGEALRELHPLDIGTTWVYAVHDHGEPSGTHTKQITSQAGVDLDLLDAVAMSSRYTDYPGAGATSSLVYLGLAGDAILQQGVYSRYEFQAAEPPPPAYRLPVEAGNSWSHKGKVGDMGLSFDVTVEAVEDVEVSGRTFEDCAHYVTDYEWKIDGEKLEEQLEEWTCPGYGPVRTIDRLPARDVEITEELVEFHGRAGNWRSDDAPAADAADDAAAGPGSTPGSTLGFDPGRTAAVPEGSVSPRLAWSVGHSVDVGFAPVGNDEVYIVGESDGLVSARDTDTHEVRWRVRFEGPVVAPPALAGDTVLVADATKNLWALGLEDGSARWVRVLDDVVSASPAVGTSTAVVPTEDAMVTALDLATGETVWEAALADEARTAPALAGDRVVVADVSGEVNALDLEDGDRAWTATPEGAVTAGPTVVDGLALAADYTGSIHAWDLDDGDLVWEALSRHAPTGAIAAGGGRLVLRTDDDRLEAYDLEDGAPAWSGETADSGLSPVVVGDQVVSVSADGLVEVLGLADGRRVDSWPLPVPAKGADVDPDVPIGLVGDVLVVGGDVDAEAHTSAFFGYPVTADAARRGVSFGSSVRVLPASSWGPPVLDGGGLIVPGQDNVVYRSTGLAELEPLMSSSAGLPGVATGHGLVITQVDNQWQAVPTSGGEPAWTFPATTPLPGSLPAFGEDTVYLPEHGVGLAAADPATGQARWVRQVQDDVGGTTPLVLPNGDAVYATGELARYDAESGRTLWSMPDIALFNNATYDDGVVYANAVRNEHPSGLMALDAGTGRRLWFHPDAETPIAVSPAAADGVVVYANAKGLVTAFDGRSGEQLWQFRLSTPVAGTPVIHDGRVFLAETGRDEDLYQREYRISAHDLRTGAFLGSYEPPGPAYASVASVGAGPDGELLVPTSTRLGSVVMILEAQQ